MKSGLTSDFVPTNGITLHTIFAGPEDGAPVFLLHGFPDAWFGWEAQIGPLAEAGFRVIVPDQRGYNLSDKPAGVSGYRMQTLVDDIAGLAAACGYQSFYVAGHDFGAMVAWHLTMRRPTPVKRLAIANVPHPDVMRTFLRTSLAQMRRSWYMLFFQLPGLPECVAKANNWRFLMSAMPADLTDQQRTHYRDAWSQTNATTSMINWYRGALRSSQRATSRTEITVPTLILWGKQDPHLSYQMARTSTEHSENARLVTFEDATHWVMHDKPKEVSRLLIEHFSAGGPT